MGWGELIVRLILLPLVEIFDLFLWLCQAKEPGQRLALACAASALIILVVALILACV